MTIPITGSHRGPGEPPGDVISLDRVDAPGTVQVLDTDGRGVTRQLAQLGIRAGKIVKVRRLAPMGGPVLVESGGTTVAVGRGMARKVTVRLLP